MPMQYLNQFAVQCFENWDVCFSIMRDVDLDYIGDLFSHGSLMLIFPVVSIPNTSLLKLWFCAVSP